MRRFTARNIMITAAYFPYAAVIPLERDNAADVRFSTAGMTSNP